MFRRISVMSGPEIWYRLSTVVSDAAERALRRTPVELARAEQRIAGDALRASAAGRGMFVPPCDTSATDEAQLLAGRIPVFGAWIPVESDPAFWHTDPFSSAVWPRQPYRQIDYRPGNPTGDVRTVWELNRLQHLFALALIAHGDEGRRADAVRIIESHLVAWTAANPPGEGVNYLSAMEEALRLVAVFHAYALVSPWVSDQCRDIVAGLAVYHARHVAGRVSQHSSAGNHTIAEAVGLLYAGIVLQGHPCASEWRNSGLEHLRRESARQVDADGGGLEQATWYLLFITDLLGLAQSLLSHAGMAPEPRLDAAVQRARAFLNDLATGPGDLPRIGDGDDGYALWRGLQLSWTGNPASRRHVSYRAHGLSFVRYGDSDRLIFLHNPLGMPPGCAHGHADSLSVLFRWEGIDVLIDPGTYQYGAEARYRQYFRSTAAHNTATVDSGDQAEQLTAFMWRRPFTTELLLSQFEPDCAWLLARHDGYRPRGIVHRRGIVYRERQFLAVWDSFGGSGAASVALNWHLGCAITDIDQPRRQIGLDLPSGRRMRVEVSDGTPARVRGSLDPLLGWRSDRYGHKEPCDVLRVPFAPVPARPVLTLFWLGEPGRMSEIWPLCARFDGLS